MLALPFDAKALEHHLYVVDRDPEPELLKRLLQEFGRIDRGRARATLLSVGGPFREKEWVKGFGLELVEWNGRSAGRATLLGRLRAVRDKLTELGPANVHLHLREHRLAWKLAGPFTRAARPAQTSSVRPAGPIDRDRVALVLKSDLGRKSAHVVQALHTASALVRQGARVRVVAPLAAGRFASLQQGGSTAAERIDHLRLRPVRRSSSYCRYLRSVLEELAADGFGTLYFRQVRIASMLLPAARELGFRVFMEAHQPYTTWALHERKRLWSANGPSGWQRRLARFDRDYEARCYRELTGVICTTAAMVARVARLDPHCPSLLLRNGVPEPPPASSVLPQAARPIDLIYAGRTSEAKCTDVLIRALLHLEGVGLTIVGGPTDADLAPFRALSRELGLQDRIEFLPWEEQAWLFKRIGRAKLAVHPLAGRGSREWRLFTCPLKVLECMALGTPVVATDLPALREVIEDGVTGRLVAPGDPAALAAGLRELLEDPGRAEQFARAARERAAHWTHAVRAERLWKFLQTSERTAW